MGGPPSERCTPEQGGAYFMEHPLAFFTGLFEVWGTDTLTG